MGWGAVPREAVELLAVAAVGTRLGEWYPSWLLRGALPFRCSLAGGDAFSNGEPFRVPLDSAAASGPDCVVIRHASDPGSPQACCWANPFEGVEPRSAAIARFQQHAPLTLQARVLSLRVKKLICSCPAAQPCHLDVLVEMFR